MRQTAARGQERLSDRLANTSTDLPPPVHPIRSNLYQFLVSQAQNDRLSQQHRSIEQIPRGRANNSSFFPPPWFLSFFFLGDSSLAWIHFPQATGAVELTWGGSSNRQLGLSGFIFPFVFLRSKETSKLQLIIIFRAKIPILTSLVV